LGTENSNTEALFYIILSLVTSWPIGYACSHVAYWRGCKDLHTSNIDPLVIIFFSWWSFAQSRWLHELQKKWHRSAENLCYSRKWHSCTIL